MLLLLKVNLMAVVIVLLYSPDGLKKAGSVYDEIEIEGGVVKAIKRVGSVDLGSLTWAPDTNNYAATITSLGFRIWSSGHPLGKDYFLQDIAVQWLLVGVI